MSENPVQSKHKASLGISLIPILFLVVALGLGILVYEKDPHIPLFTSALFAALIANRFLHIDWAEIEKGMIETIGMGMQACLILMVIGMVIGTWILGGIVPAMIYYGLKILSPSIFLVASVIMCSIVALATGSSWTTAGTVGIALIGIGTSIGIPKEVCAGAIISGAYFGDKMSPLSDTTNLAPAMAGSTLFEHISHMVYTTVVSYGLTLVIFLVLGFRYAGSQLDLTQIQEMNAAMEAAFNLNPLLLLIPVITIGLVIMKVPAIPGLFIGGVLGGIAAVAAQGQDLGAVLEALHYGYVSETGFEFVDELLTRGGMDSMFWTISLILCALCFGGVMNRSGMLKAIADSVLGFVRGTGSLALAVALTCVGINVLASDQYLSLVIPGTMYKDEYMRRGLDPCNLSRTLEDTGTVTSALVPWNTCGATMITFLTLDPWTYVPYSFFNLLSPIVNILYGFFGITQKRLTPEKIAEIQERGAWPEDLTPEEALNAH
ncbi:MAG: Na+/H+ antiporter NhaC [Tissierellia bacterium]|nr:Na+/H+ antiporter NhaC [Tissierellia bacterium]